MEESLYSVPLSELIENFKLENLTPEIKTDNILIKDINVNRPALQLAGFFDYFDSERIQIIGNVENAYMHQMSLDRQHDVMNRLMEYKIPCIIFCRGLDVPDIILNAARLASVPVLRTDKATSAFMSEAIRYMRHQLAPRISLHGVLVDVYGEGVLIMGESGIGKSETALELIKRGHRLVSDDVVEIKKISEDTLVGTAPEITRHLIELRGIGIVDVRSLYGFASVRTEANIDLVIKLMEWDKDLDFDRLGLEEQYTEILGINVVSHNIPIRPGRNLALICEAAAVNNRQKKMGYNAAKELYNRVTNNMKKHAEEAESAMGPDDDSDGHDAVLPDLSDGQ
ncbi:MAG: HPr(Ser) kinase/phosphatase [Catonella sp.]|nr:HPr(Ser) kinase/phosphatase [Catonella sp.]MDY6357245.1 HPr(Ser) kinase/phosphatase [Catonella sp.]